MFKILFHIGLKIHLTSFREAKKLTELKYLIRLSSLNAL